MATRKQTRDIPTLRLRAAFRPESVDLEARTVDLVWTTGARVLRRNIWGDAFYEELSLKRGHVRLDRLNNRAPLLDSHMAWSVRGQLGVVEKARIKGGAEGEGIATVRFPRAEDDEDADQVLRKIADGIVCNVSVGYAVHKFERVEESDDGIPVMRATDWEPFEISMVSIGADDGAVTRSHDETTNPCVFVTDEPEEHRSMPDNIQDPQAGQGGSAPATPATPATEAPQEGTRSASPAPPAQPAMTDAEREQIRAEAAEAERQRVAEIRSISEGMGLPAELVREHAEKNSTPVDEFRRIAIEAHVRREDATPTPAPEGRPSISGGEGLRRKGAVEGARNALLHRGDPAKNELSDAGRMYRGMTLLEMARSYLEDHGARTRGLSKHEVAAMALGLEVRAGMHSVSDFPHILADVAGKTLRAAYDDTPQTFRAWARRATLPDFKEVKRTQFGEAPQLIEIPEGAEYTYGTIGEAREVYSLATYGRKFSITRQTLINDDLDAFSRVPMLYGRRARELESDLVYAHLTSNPVMGDGVALIHANHGNTGTGVINVANVGSGREAMRKQTGINGQRINVMPRTLLVPAALETDAEQFVATNLRPAQVGDINVFAGKLVAIAEPRLDDASTTEWWLVGDPAAIDTLEYGYLEGEEGVAIENRIGFDVDGLEIKARLDFGVKAIDHRGFYRSSGV